MRASGTSSTRINRRRRPPRERGPEEPRGSRIRDLRILTEGGWVVILARLFGKAMARWRVRVLTGTVVARSPSSSSGLGDEPHENRPDRHPVARLLHRTRRAGTLFDRGLGTRDVPVAPGVRARVATGRGVGAVPARVPGPAIGAVLVVCIRGLDGRTDSGRSQPGRLARSLLRRPDVGGGRGGGEGRGR